MRMMWSGASKTAISTAGGLVAAIGSTLCCAGPLVAVFIGVSGAGLARTFEPLRPFFVAVTIGAFAYGHWTVRKLNRAVCAGDEECAAGTVCASPNGRRWINLRLWTATAVAAPLLLFPWWSRFVFQ